MKKIKKIWGCLMILTTFASAVCVTPAAVSAESKIKYNQTFETAGTINDLSSAKGASMDGNVTICHNSEKKCAEFDASAARSGFVLPETVNEVNYVMEMDLSYKKKANHNGTDAIRFGPIFAYRDPDNCAYMGYNPENGALIMYNAIEGTTVSRNAENGNGSSVLLAEEETAHIKLIMNNGLMEFFVNGELCYTYYSPDETRVNAAAANQRANNYATGGRVGIFAQANRTTIFADNIRVRTVDATDVSYYSNSFNDPNMDEKFQTLNGLSGYFPQTAIGKGSWGCANYIGSGYSNVGQYIPVRVSGDYMIDIDFSMKDPLNDSRWIGIAFGINANDNGTMNYNLAGVHENGGLFLSQKEISVDGADFEEHDISGANIKYGNVKNTISSDKKNPSWDGENDNYLLSYVPANYTSTGYLDKINKRHKMRVTVVNGKATFTIEGTTVFCDIDANRTDGFVGIRSAGTGAEIYSVRVAPYYVDEPVIELKTTMEFEYSEIGSSYALADIIVDDPLECVDDNTRVLVAVYDGNTLIGTDIQPVADGTTFLEVSYDEISNTDGLTIRAFLWNMATAKPLTECKIPL